MGNPHQRMSSYQLFKNLSGILPQRGDQRSGDQGSGRGCRGLTRFSLHSPRLCGSKIYGPIFFSLLLFCLVAVVPVAPLQAQAEEIPVERLFITGTSADSLPDIEVRLYGRDSQGNPLDFSRETVTIEHGQTAVGPINYQGAHRTGTFTLFLIDIPTGVQAQLPAIQDAINQYASPGNMMEQVDYAAVYQVGAAEARQLLAPTNFHNAVRNLFAEPLAPETGATALYDSTAALLNQAAGLSPNGEMPIQIVLMTDGTDAVSTGTSGDGLIAQAAELGIPIHTIWLDNANLPNNTFGQEYLARLAAGSGGVAVQLNNAADLPLVWNRIAGFRDQARIRYQVTGLTGGTFPVSVSLADQPWISGETEVTIPFNIPSVVIELPPESRTLSLPNLEEPVRLRFQTQISWLDGEEREVTSAQLVVNGDTAVPYEIPVESLDAFVADIGNLSYGNNTLEVMITDSQGMRATSPTVILTVNEGRTQIPGELNSGGTFLRFASRLLLILIVAAVLAGVVFLLWQQGVLHRLRPAGMRLGSGGRRNRRRRPGVQVDEPAPAYAGTTVVMAYLDVLESVSRMESPLPLQGSLIRIGRSPAQCEIAFENDITVSRLHANLQLEGSDYRLFDENSTSGTFVNERQVPEYGILLVEGDEIHLGAVHLRYRRA